MGVWVCGGGFTMGGGADVWGPAVGGWRGGLGIRAPLRWSVERVSSAISRPIVAVAAPRARSEEARRPL
jgi:hypothetical protein